MAVRTAGKRREGEKRFGMKTNRTADAVKAKLDGRRKRRTISQINSRATRVQEELGLGAPA